MLSLEAKSVSLVYPLQSKFSLAMSANKQAKLPNTGGQIITEGRRQFVKALDDISFRVEEGQRIGLIGPNGAGKTTLLKVLYGIYEPSDGTIESNGKVDALFNIRLGFRAEATGRRNIYLRGLINGWTRDQIDEHMESIIEFSELHDFIDVPLKTYSQGMSARLAFSIATTMKPEILLMDEWIGAGDGAFRKKASKKMQELTDGASITLLASHSREILKSFSDQVIVLEKGKIIAHDKTDVIMRNF